jgi:hypothetical protein
VENKRRNFRKIIEDAEVLDKADRFHGMFPHLMYGATGKVRPFSKMIMVQI